MAFQAEGAAWAKAWMGRAAGRGRESEWLVL